MSRPVYERDSDLQRERAAIEQIEGLWGLRFEKTPRFYAIDFCIVNSMGRVCGWVEIKGKTFPKNTYPTFFTSVEKLLRLLRMSQFTGLPAYLVCCWQDGVFFIQPTPMDCRTYAIKIGGRTDRGDADDVEPVAHIPIEHFKPVSQMFI